MVTFTVIEEARVSTPRKQRPLVVFIPGTMGSSLESRGQPRQMLWGRDIWASLLKLDNTPQLLRYSNLSPATATGVLCEITHPFGTTTVCALLRAEVTQLATNGRFTYAEFPYDWRQSVTDTAADLGQWLSAHHGFVQRDGKQEPEAGRRLTIVAHSMGGLVAAAAMMREAIHPANVANFIAIGTPFLGAAAAFLALFDTGYLPGLSVIRRFTHKGRNARSRRRVLLATAQSFESTYELLPHMPAPFVSVRGASTVHPFTGTVIPQALSTAAMGLHSSLDSFEQLLVSHRVPYHLLFGSATKRSIWRHVWLLGRLAWTNQIPNDTCMSLEASIGSDSSANATYQDIRVQQKVTGDGTVPAHSAALGWPTQTNRHEVVGANHMTICDHPEVVAMVLQHLP
jgi:pimeloyl-ACP methyl ester carboxylesterase